jgi:DNA polymerase
MARDEYPGAEQFVPEQRNRDDLAMAAADCRGCPLYKNADQVVFGEGPTDARLMLVGESPGRNEDKQGRPFIGDAGKLLERVLEEAGLSRDEVYITNAVKHIRWSGEDGSGNPKAPGAKHIQACRPWLDAEMQMVTPQRIVALGTRAARGVLGQEVTISKSRDQFHNSLWGVEAVVTYHPAAALRHPVSEERDRIFERMVEDLRRAQRPLEGPSPEPELRI